MQIQTESKAYQKLMDRLARRAKTAAEELHDQRMARVIEQIVEEIRTSRQQEIMETVTVREAAELTGYSESTIWRHLEQQKLQSVGEEGRVLLRVRDLPFKSGPESFHPAVLRRTAAPPTSPGSLVSGAARGAKLTLIEESA